METAYGSWKEDLLQVVQSTTCEHQVFNMLTSLAHTMEFDFCAYGLCVPLPLTRPKTAVFNNYPADWQKVYPAKGYLCVDPTIQRARCTPSTVI
jgi:LuxR family transcriptional regulator